LEAELETAVVAFPQLPGTMAQQIATRRIAALEEELTNLKNRQEPMLQQLDQLYNEVALRKGRLNAARQSLAGAENRQKTEALAQVIERIVCHFRPTEGRGRQPASVLERVEIVPAPGDATPVSYPADLFESRVGSPTPPKKQGTCHARHHRRDQRTQ